MGRRANHESPKPYLEPVEKIEVSEKHIGRRVIAAAVFLLIGIGAFAYFIVGLVRGEPGWTEITALSSRVNCGGDFVFLYEVGADGGSAQSEKRDVTAAYTAAAEKAYWMFENVRAAGDFAEEDDGSGAAGRQEEAGAADAAGTAAEDEGSGAETAADGTGQAETYGNDAAVYANEIHGCAVAEAANGKAAVRAAGSVRFINDHPNEEITIDAPLYEAFAKLDAAGGRWLYLPAVYQTYNNLFASEADPIAAEFDPRVNEEVAAYFKEVLAYANDPDAVELELLGDNRVRLSVSDEYLVFAAENGIDSFIDFYWMKNAFIADYLAESLMDAGFTNGSISSYDGFVRNLDGRDVSYSFNLYDRAVTGAESSGEDGQIRQLAIMQYYGPISLVYLHDYAITSMDQQRYYQMDGGEMRTPYIDPQDGLCRNSISSLVSYSYDGSMGCADILLSVIPVYIADEFDADAVDVLAGNSSGANGSAAKAARTDGSPAASAGANGSSTKPEGAVYSIYRLGDEIHANDPVAEFTAVYEGYTIVK